MFPRIYLQTSPKLPSCVGAANTHGRLLHSSKVLCGSQEKEYLHASRVPTYHFQNSLPRLAIPPLEKTCERYLKAQQPLVSEAELQELQTIASEFQNNQGQELQKELVETDKKNKHTNYVTGLWFDMYLKDRRPVVLTHNPFISFNDDPRPEYNTQLIKASNMLISSTRFMKTLRDELLEPEVFHLNPAKSDTSTFRTVSRLLPSSLSWYGAYLFKAFPLDMSQYKRLFNSTRIPRPEKDELYTNEKSKHIAVLRNGNVYVFDMMDGDGNIIPETDVLAHLSYILNDNTPAAEFPISTLTSEYRDPWTQARIQLIKADPQNEERLRLVDGAMFVLCLDDDQPGDPDAMTRSFLYGNGSNRWFDKSFQLIITKEGTAAVHFEHAWGDGVAVLRYFREVYSDALQKSRVHPDTKPSPNASSDEKVVRLNFTLDPSVKEAVAKAKSRFDDVTNSLDVSHIQYHKMTKTHVKKAKLSPDSIMQLTVQLAHYRMYGKNVGTYESCSTSAFKHGRTETVRSCTSATKAMCERLYGSSGPQGSADELMEGLRDCSKVHGQLTKEAAMGQGFDRHLYFLKHMAESRGLSLPMFTHPAYANLNHIILSTSTLSDPAVLIGGFAAVTPDGFGVGYGIENNAIGFNITSYPACSASDFVANCEKSLDDIHDILKGQKPACKS
ncbi:carnitine O-palmitoyltransferase 2, mitochondrial [Aplysia californica]|uniref:Carnitine O-palmitoyltransferase 2, mitochondrial n=1 Tax=Aplysia californica TaxID=6500 RepID=A0ABM0JNI0_APLCA|nr:carnitine O-palmitoyltransferase 2, mitochondrial [Aplysia californica]